MIDRNFIEQEYHRAITFCSEIYPIKKWRIAPTKLELTPHKSKYGMARHDGTLFIASSFIGTTAVVTLRNTLRHELAHFAAGLRNGHNRVFRRYEKMFHAKERAHKSEVASMRDIMHFKWQLFAHLEDGTIKDIGGAHRRSRAYLDYPKNGRIMVVDKQLVKAFNYVENIKEACF